jgi:hypothetical protein
MKYFVHEGRLTVLAELVLGALVLLGLIGIPVFNLPIWIAIPIGVVSAVAGAVLMFEGRATALGLKPFTNDPLGWREAKKSYQNDSEPHAEKTSDREKDI